ncbi:MAG: amidohydrolase [Clostridiales bacterium]|nr:amidohydrolase [Clostridiales bacterium]
MDKDIRELAVELRHELHMHPELSNHEAQSKQRLMDFLQRHAGLELVDKGRWFYAHYKSGSKQPGIAFRADMDAIALEEDNSLPYHSLNTGAAHKCGHDGHCASLAAFAVEVGRHGAPRDVYFLFQHAEETGDGAIECCEIIRECDIGEIFAFHNMPEYPYGAVVAKDGTMNCASKGVCVSLIGAPSHASAPENGMNPAQAAAKIILSVPRLLLGEQFHGLVQCTVVHMKMGEKNFGISPGEAELCFTCRGQYEHEMEMLIGELLSVARKTCESDGFKLEVSYSDAFPETANHRSSVEKIRKACSSLGYEFIEMQEPLRGSEDYGHYTKLTDGAIFFIGAGDVPDIHTDGFDFDDSLIEKAVEVFKHLAAI